MKKILFVAHMQSHIMNFHIPFIKNFEKNGYEVWVATKLDSKYLNFEMSNIKWINIDFTRSPLNKNIIKALKQLINLMKKEKFNLIHVHTPVGGVLGRIAAKITKNGPVIYTAHGFHFFKGAPKSYWMTYYPIEKIMSKFTDAIITMNNEDFENAKNRLLINNKHIYKVNGVGVNIKKFSCEENLNLSFRKKIGLTQDDFIITVIAELSRRKNQIQLINAMKNINEECPNIKVLLVGEGDLYDFYKSEIIKYNLEKKVILLGHRKDVNKILQISNLVGLFSNQEGLPKNLLEALAAGKPIICTNVRGNNELVEDNVNGFLVELNNIESTVGILKKIYMNQEILEDFKQQSKLKAKEYSEQKIISDMDKIYSKYIID